MPTEPGQAAFGAIQEIVRNAASRSADDWSKVDIDALRQHLIDMDEVTMRAAAQKEPIENGLRIKVTGSDRTLEAIQRMVPAHARDIDGINGWTVRAQAISEWCGADGHRQQSGRRAEDPRPGLHGHHGARGHHQMHHLAMAKGEPMHMQ